MIFRCGRWASPADIQNMQATAMPTTRRTLFSRHRALLAIMDEAGDYAEPSMLIHLAFLLRQEARTAGGSAFFQFLPYKTGPHSFVLDQEARKLASAGLLDQQNDGSWALTRTGKQAACDLDVSVRADIRELVRRAANRSVDWLRHYVFDHYPWFTLNARSGGQIDRPVADIAVYTAGYEGLHVDGFLNGLLRVGIHRLVDVRNNPVARRFGFHGSTLNRLCQSVGIEYVHMPDLGIPSSMRANINAEGARERLLADYATKTLPERTQNIRHLTSLVRQQPTVLVCVEADPSCCHRASLAEMISDEARLTCKHLELQA